MEHGGPRATEPTQSNLACRNKLIEAFLEWPAVALFGRIVHVDHRSDGANSERREQHLIEALEPLVVPEGASNVQRDGRLADDVQYQAIEAFHIGDRRRTDRGGQDQPWLRGMRGSGQCASGQHLADDHQLRRSVRGHYTAFGDHPDSNKLPPGGVDHVVVAPRQGTCPAVKNLRRESDRALAAPDGLGE